MNSSSARRRSRRHRLRTERGGYLLELLVALFVLGLIAMALAATLSEAFRLSTKAQNQMTVTWIASQVLDRLKASNDIYLMTAGESRDLQLNSGDPISPNDKDFQKRPLLLDTDNLKWTAPVASPQDPLYKFKANPKVTVTVNGGTTVEKQITLNITWGESGGSRNFLLRSNVSKAALHLEGGL